MPKKENPIYYLFLLIVFFLPLIFVRILEDSFSLPKISFLIIVLLIIIGFLLFEKIFKKKSFFFFKNVPWFLNLAIFLFILQSLLAVFFSINPEISFWGFSKRWEGFVTWLAYFTLFYLTVYLIKSEQSDQINKAERIFLWIIIASCLSSFYAFLQYFKLDPFSWGTNFGERVFSSLANPNFLAGYMVMVLPLALYFYFSRKNKNKSLIFILAALMIFSSILFSQSRGGFLALVGGLIIFFILGGIKFFWQHKQKSLILIISFFILFFFFGGSLSQRLKQTFIPKTNLKKIENIENIESIGNSENTQERIYIWQKTLKIIKEYPLVGIGPDNLRLIFNNYERLDDPSFHSFTIVDRVHNDFLEMAVSRGIPGLVFYLFILISFIYLFCKNFKNQSQKLLFASLGASMTAYLIQNQFSFSIIALSSLFWILGGCLVGFCQFQSFFRKLSQIESETATINQFYKLKSTTTILGFIFFFLFLFFSFYFLRTLQADFYCKQGENIRLSEHPNLEKELSFYKKALKLRPNFHLYQEKIIIALSQNSFQEKEKRIFQNQELIKEAKKIVSLNPKNGFYQRALGLAYLRLNQEENSRENLEEAEKAIQKTIELTPTFSSAYSDLAKIYFLSKKDYAIIENLFEKALKTKRKSFDANTALNEITSTIFDVAKFYFDQGEKEKTISLLEKILKYYPEYLIARRNLGVIYYKLGDNEKAKGEFEKVLQLNPNDLEVQKVLEKLK